MFTFSTLRKAAGKFVFHAFGSAIMIMLISTSVAAQSIFGIRAPESDQAIAIEGMTPILQGTDYALVQRSNTVAILQPNPLKGTFRYLGSGVLLSSDQVLTSAHVVNRSRSNQIVACSGDAKIGFVTSIQIHKKYSKGEVEHDLAIIDLDHPLPFLEYSNLPIQQPSIIGFALGDDKALRQFALPLQLEEGSLNGIPQSPTTYLVRGHSGSPLYIPNDDCTPELSGIFSQQMYSRDRSSPTRYFFTPTDGKPAETDYIEIESQLGSTHTDLVPIHSPGDYSFQLLSITCFNEEKNLHALTFISRVDKPLKVSISESPSEPVSVQIYPIYHYDKKTYLSGDSSSVTLEHNECLTLIFELKNQPLPVEVSIHFVTQS